MSFGPVDTGETLSFRSSPYGVPNRGAGKKRYEPITTVRANNLPMGTTEADLMACFGPFGLVPIGMVVQSEGLTECGFVRFGTRDEALNAIQGLKAGSILVGGASVAAEWALENLRVGQHQPTQTSVAAHQEKQRLANPARVVSGMLPPLSPDDINALILQREDFRRERQFSDADGVRQQLRDHGVELYDRDKEWKCNDGRRGFYPTATIPAVTSQVSFEEVAPQVCQREVARRARDFEQADQIRLQLRQLGVELFDKERQWRAAEGHRYNYIDAERFMGQTLQPDAIMPVLDGPNTFAIGGAAANRVCALSDEDIRKLVSDRERARLSHSFELADSVREQLRGHGVDCFDNERTWKACDGRSGLIVAGSEQLATCRLTDADIMQLVTEREVARRAHEWERADSVRLKLRANGVELLDKDHEWRTVDGRRGPYSYTGSEGAGRLTGLPQVLVGSQAAQQQSGMGVVPLPCRRLSEQSIQILIGAREQARAHHDWVVADAIRDDLRSMGLQVA